MKNKEPLKVGDRVRVFDKHLQEELMSLGIDKINKGLTGTVIPRFYRPDEGWINVRLDYSQELYSFHRKQCRRLVKKPKREFWIVEYANGNKTAWNSKESASYNGGKGAKKFYRVSVMEEVEIE